MLGEMWRNATEEDRKPYVDKERQEREKYKIAIADWRVEYEKKKEEEKKQQAAQQAQQAQWAQQHQQQFQSEVVDPNVGNGQHVQYQQPPPYAIPPPGSQFAYLPPTTPQFYGKSPIFFPNSKLHTDESDGIHNNKQVDIHKILDLSNIQ